MILRSVMRHVRDQNWIAVFLDFLIVVVGVFIGIQVANWNDAQADGRLGAAYERRLIADLTKDLAMLHEVDAYYSTVLESAVETARLLQLESPTPIDLLMHAYRATELNDRTPTHSTWDQIVSSGHIGLISGEATLYLMDYFAFQASRSDYDTLLNSPYRRRVRGLVPVQVQQAFRRGCSDIIDETGTIQGFVEECRLDVDLETVDRVARRLHEDSQLAETLGYQFSELSALVSNTRGTIALVESALKRLRGEHPNRADRRLGK